VSSTSSLRILYVSSAYEPAWRWGGPPRSASALCRALVAAGVQVSVYTTDYDASERLHVSPGARVDLGGVDVTYFHAHGGPRVARAPGLRRALLANARHFDVLHIDSFWQYPGLVGALAGRLRGVPYVVTPRGSLIAGALQTGSPAKRMHSHTLGKMMVRGAEVIHLTTELERAESATSLRGVRTFIAPNPVSLDDLVPDESREVTRRRLGISNDAFVVVYSGRLHSRKALPVLLRAMARALRQTPRVKLVLAGWDAGEEARLTDMVKDLQIEPAVHVLGHLTRACLADTLQASDAVVLTPYAGENFGNACVEGMGMGLPAILSTNVGIYREAQQDGAALVVPVAEEAIADALCRLATDPVLHQRMARAAAVSVPMRYAPAAVAQAMIGLYREIA